MDFKAMLAAIAAMNTQQLEEQRSAINGEIDGADEARLGELEQLLQAGVDARRALTTLSPALALRGEETGGFTTVDLLQLDLFTGEGELYKLGAAPTYIKKGGSVQRLSGRSLPAGLAEGEASALDRFSLRLVPGDCVLMVSDGVCSGAEDGWLRERLTQFDGTSPKDLARELVTRDLKDATDDRTALVVRIDTRKNRPDHPDG